MKNDDKSTEFGRYLRTHRRSKGIPLEEVSQKTKITITVLRQLENEDLAGLPAPTFVKGFIRAYAKVVGVDVQEAVKRYEEKMAAVQPEGPGPELRQPPFKSKPLGRLVILSLCFVLLLAAVYYLSQVFQAPEQPVAQVGAVSAESDQGSTPSDDPTLGGPTVAESEERPLKAEDQPDPSDHLFQEDTPSSFAQEEAAKDPPSSLTSQESIEDTAGSTLAPPEATIPIDAKVDEEMVLEVEAVERTWFRVKIDRDQVREVTIEPKDRISFKAKGQFDLFIGNAGGIQLQLNGQPVIVPGKSGQVVTMKLP